MKRRQFLAACLAVAALLTGGLPAGAFYDTPPAWAADELPAAPEVVVSPPPHMPKRR